MGIRYVSKGSLYMQTRVTLPNDNEINEEGDVGLLARCGGGIIHDEVPFSVCPLQINVEPDE